MAEPNNLTSIIAAHRISELGSRRIACHCGWTTSEGVDYLGAASEHAAHVAAAIREARTVRTVEELYALPVGAVVREIGHKAPSGYDYGAIYERRYAEAGWREASGVYTAEPPRFPGIILYHPDWDGAL